MLNTRLVHGLAIRESKLSSLKLTL